MNFYWDINANESVDVGTDVLFGADTDGSDGWMVISAVTGIPAGVQTFLAQAEDDTSLPSNVASASVQVDTSVYWDGDGGNLDWNNALNWSGDALPGQTDAVVINDPATITVTKSSGSTIVRRIVSHNSLSFTTGSVHVTQPSVVHGNFNLSTGASLTAHGPQAEFIVTGTASIGTSSVVARDGAHISLPITSYTGLVDGNTVLRAEGTGARLEFPSLTTLSGYSRNGHVDIEAPGGGVVDLSTVTSMPSGAIRLTSEGAGSEIDLSTAVSWIDRNNSRSSFVAIHGGGAIKLDELVTLEGVDLLATGGQVLMFPKLETYQSSYDRYNYIQAIGEGSRLLFPTLHTVRGGIRNSLLNIETHAGGLVDMHMVTSMPSGATAITSRGADLSANASLVDLSALAVFNDTNGGRTSSLRADGAGTIQLSAATTSVFSVDVQLFPSGTLNVGTLELQPASRLLGSGTIPGNLVNSGAIVVGRGTGLLTVTGAYTQNANGTLQIDLEGSVAGSSYDQLAVGGLATLDGTLAVTTSGFTPQVNDVFSILTYNSASGDFSTKTGLDVGGTAVYSPTTAATAYELNTVDPAPLDTLVQWDGDAGDFNWHNAQNWDTNVVPQPWQHVIVDVAGDITITHAGSTTIKSLQMEESLTLSGGAMSVTGPAVINGTLTASNTSITVTGTRASLLANGTTSLIATNLYANEGGTIDLPNAATLAAGGTHYYINSFDEGSLISLGVTSLTGSSAGGRWLYVQAGRGGKVSMPALTSATRRIHFSQLDSASDIDLPVLSSTSSTIEFRSDFGAELVLPAVTSVTNGGNMFAYRDSRIVLPELTTYTGAGGHWYMQAFDHSVVDLPKLDSLSGSTLGGCTGGEFARQIRQDAEATLDRAAQTQLRNLLDSLEHRPDLESVTQSRPMVKKWTIADLIPNRELPWQAVQAMKTDAKRGEQMFSVAMCNRCHQMRGQGGRVGPNLLGATRRFSPHDLLEAILEPGKTIPHEFQAVKILTEDGKVVVGQVVNYGGGRMSVRTNQMEPWKLTKIDADSVERITPSATSLMPTGLLDTLHKEEVFDLLQWMAGQ